MDVDFFAIQHRRIKPCAVMQHDSPRDHRVLDDRTGERRAPAAPNEHHVAGFNAARLRVLPRDREGFAKLRPIRLPVRVFIKLRVKALHALRRDKGERELFRRPGKAFGGLKVRRVREAVRVSVGLNLFGPDLNLPGRGLKRMPHGVIPEVLKVHETASGLGRLKLQDPGSPEFLKGRHGVE